MSNIIINHFAYMLKWFQIYMFVLMISL